MPWEILHVPEKLPNSNEQSTVNVFASEIDPKLANTIVRKLNQVAPLENLRHVKRVRWRSIEGKTQLSAVLCLSLEDENQLEVIPNNVLELINSYQLIPFMTKVAKYAASSKKEWEEQCKLWPTSFHPPTYNIDGITGFNEKDSQLVFNFMNVAIELAKSCHLGDQVVNAAVIVDPSIRQVIASASDQTCLCPTAPNKFSVESISSMEQAEIIPSNNSDTSLIASNENPLRECTRSYTGVSCLYPWRWTEQRPYIQKSPVKFGSTYSWHPLRHATLVAIEYAASRDRHLYAGMGHTEDLSSSVSSMAKRQKSQLSEDEAEIVSEAPRNGFHSEVEAPVNGLHSEAMRPYLCTGFDIYLVWEPCTMCAMALVHQRIRRIFFALPNPNAGALGSVHRLQGEKSLNHHYAVFRVLVPQEVLDIAVSIAPTAATNLD